jgi:hypothetical protein
MSDAGRWQQIQKQIWDTIVTACDCCGQVVARRLWVVSIGSEPHRFCGEQCEELYREHVLPRRERAGRGMGNVEGMTTDTPFA